MFEELVVIELASVLAGPSVGMFFAELGAKVIKIENSRTGGDVTRSWKLPSESRENSVSAYFSAVNWGKDALALDLTQPEARQQVYALLRTADVVISSYIPGKAEELGMDAETLRRINPRLICAEINGYGSDLPRAAFDAIIQAEAGFTFMNGNSPDTTHKMPVALVDVLAAHQLKEAVLLALIHRMKTGEGSRVSVSLLQAAVSALVNQATNYLVAGHIPQPEGSEHPNIVPYGTIFTTADGSQIVLAVGNDAQFWQLCAELHLPENEAFASNQQRVRARYAVNSMLAEAIGKRRRDELLAALIARHVPAGAVNDMKSVWEMPQAQQLVLQAGILRGFRGFVAETSFAAKAEILSPPPTYPKG